MKKLNITKKQFGESKYFTNKYGTLKYVSESGKIFKTSKGHLLKFKEAKEKHGTRLRVSLSQLLHLLRKLPRR